MPWWGWVAVGAGGTLVVLGVPAAIYLRRWLHDWDRAWGYR